MKIAQRSLCLLLVALLSACTGGTLEAAIPPTAIPTSTLPPPTATATRAPLPSRTPTVGVSFLCPRASSSETEWECREDPHGWTRTCSPASPSAQEWECYEDLDYGFALAYPPGWETSVWSTDFPSGWVERRHSFHGPQIAFDLDIWMAAGRDLTHWLEEMSRIVGPELFPPMEPNATVAGHPAVMFADSPESHDRMLTVFFGDGAHFYQLLCPISSKEGLATVRQILGTIRFSPEPVAAEIPDDLWQQVVDSCSNP